MSRALGPGCAVRICALVARPALVSGHCGALCTWIVALVPTPHFAAILSASRLRCRHPRTTHHTHSCLLFCDVCESGSAMPTSACVLLDAAVASFHPRVACAYRRPSRMSSCCRGPGVCAVCSAKPVELGVSSCSLMCAAFALVHFVANFGTRGCVPPAWHPPPQLAQASR